MLKSIILIIEGFTMTLCWKAPSSLTEGFTKNFTSSYGGITAKHCFRCSFKTKHSLHCCAYSLHCSFMLLHILCCTVVPSSLLRLPHTAVSTLVVVSLHFTYISLQTLHCCAFFKDIILCLFRNDYSVPPYKFTLLCVNISSIQWCCICCISIQWTTHSLYCCKGKNFF